MLVSERRVSTAGPCSTVPPWCPRWVARGRGRFHLALECLSLAAMEQRKAIVAEGVKEVVPENGIVTVVGRNGERRQSLVGVIDL